MKKHIYIAACDNGEKGGIYHYEQNADGSLNELGFYHLESPMYLTVYGDKMYVILREPFADNKSSGVMTFNIENDGSLTKPTACSSTEGLVACHISVVDGEIYCVNYVSGSVIKVGKKLVMNIGKGPHERRQDKSHTHYVNASPDGKYIFATDLGLDTIFVYDKDLNEVSRAKVPAGHGVRHLICSNDGKTVFSANELASSLSAFDYDSEHGTLILRDTLYGLPEDFAGVNTMAAIRNHNDVIYASNRGHDSISCFEYKDGKISLKDIVSVGGSGPRDFDFIGDFVYSTNERTNDVTVLKNDNGILTVLPFKYSMPDPLCVVSIDK